MPSLSKIYPMLREKRCNVTTRNIAKTWKYNLSLAGCLFGKVLKSIKHFQSISPVPASSFWQSISKNVRFRFRFPRSVHFSNLRVLFRSCLINSPVIVHNTKSSEDFLRLLVFSTEFVLLIEATTFVEVCHSERFKVDMLSFWQIKKFEINLQFTHWFTISLCLK